jgi:hypothetical protein
MQVGFSFDAGLHSLCPHVRRAAAACIDRIMEADTETYTRLCLRDDAAKQPLPNLSCKTCIERAKATASRIAPARPLPRLPEIAPAIGEDADLENRIGAGGSSTTRILRRLVDFVHF